MSKTRRLLRANELETLRTELRELLYGEEPVTGRFDRFVERVGGLEKAMIVSLASEALHFTEPRRYWLWTHWIWNPGSGTGALPLVTQDQVELEGDQPTAWPWALTTARARPTFS